MLNLDLIQHGETFLGIKIINGTYVHVAWSGKSHFINTIKYIFNTKPDYNLVFLKKLLTHSIYLLLQVSKYFLLASTVAISIFNSPYLSKELFI